MTRQITVRKGMAKESASGTVVKNCWLPISKLPESTIPDTTTHTIKHPMSTKQIAINMILSNNLNTRASNLPIARNIEAMNPRWLLELAVVWTYSMNESFLRVW
jgi:hypothetical protein